MSIIFIWFLCSSGPDIKLENVDPNDALKYEETLPVSYALQKILAKVNLRSIYMPDIKLILFDVAASRLSSEE